MKRYRVEITLKFPSAFDSGCTLDITAQNKREAIRLARIHVRTHCLYDPHDGPLHYRAEEDNDAS